MRANHPSNSNRGGVCLYFKKHLLLIRINYLSILQESLVTEIITDSEKCFLQAIMDTQIKIMRNQKTSVLTRIFYQTSTIIIQLAQFFWAISM